MKNTLLFAALVIVSVPQIASAQVGGGASGGFGGGGFAGNAGGASVYREEGSSPAQNERAKRQAGYGYYSEPTTAFIEASVLMNVKADEYVAVFGVSEEGTTPEEASTKMDATLAQFKTGIKALGIAEDDIFVDYVVQNRIYSYDFERLSPEKPNSPFSEKTTVASEKLTGFVLKKNISIHFKDKTLVDQLAVVASRSRIYDLVKVDYVVKDREAIQARLQAQTVAIIKRKAALYEGALGVQMPSPMQIVVDKPSVYYPIEQYDSYKAAEEDSISVPGGYVVQRARKSSSTFFNPLSGAEFDAVINPIIIEPVVQFTTYIKVRYAAPQKKRK